jgi:hypothetical protein
MNIEVEKYVKKKGFWKPPEVKRSWIAVLLVTHRQITRNNKQNPRTFFETDILVGDNPFKNC